MDEEFGIPAVCILGKGSHRPVAWASLNVPVGCILLIQQKAIVLATFLAAPLEPASLRSRAAAARSASASSVSSRSSARRPSPPTKQHRILPWLLSSALAASLCWLVIAGLWFWHSDLSGSDSETVSSTPGIQVTYGSLVKLMHERTKYRLHSHDIPYGSGSGQQSVTGFGGVGDSNSYWIVNAPADSTYHQGDAIDNGAMIRLQHMRTRRWLHSHAHPSPISGNFEVSCFGGDKESDTGDLWIVEFEKGGVWTTGQKVRFQHVDTGALLHSHDKKYTRIASGQQEVCGVRQRTADNVWVAAEGVYLPPIQKVKP